METHTSNPPQLMAHQAEDVGFIQAGRRVLLANDPGTGKSRSAIEATQGMRTLVIAPSMVINGGTWSGEIERWADTPDRFTVAPYSMLCRRAGRGVAVHAIRPELKQRYDAVIIDEAHYVKGRATSWTWATRELCKTADVVVEMTGTPIPNWAHELFTLLQLLYPDESKPGGRFGSYWRWAEAWFDCAPTRFSNGTPVVGELLACNRACLRRPADDPCTHYQRFMAVNLGERYRRVRRDDVLDLPPLTEQVIETPLSTTHRKIYASMKRDYCADVAGREVVSWTNGSREVNLAKITTSPWLLEENRSGTPVGGKFDRLAFDLSGRTSPTLVLAHFNDTTDACARVAQSVGSSVRVVSGRTSAAQDRESVAAFRAGQVDVLVGSLEKVAEGLQLQAADLVIFVETSFKPYRNEQAVRRAHRLGQTRPVTVYRYVTPRSVDAKKQRLVAVKTDRQMRYLSAAEYAELL